MLQSMPTLKNPRHELFCQLTLQGAKYGWTQADIYKRAGCDRRPRRTTLDRPYHERKGDQNMTQDDWDQGDWGIAVAEALTDFGIEPHPDDIAGSLVPLLQEIDDYFSGDMRAAYHAMKARQIEFDYVESNYCNWRIRSGLSKIPEWKASR
jgi:hypothetical protein